MRLEYRMYFFVNRSLSSIQKGIQAGHCALEYAREYGQTYGFIEFLNHNKTWIILDGGSSQAYDGLIQGDMENIADTLEDAGIPHRVFHEPDLNCALTAVCFICDERVWNKEKYPDFVDIIDMICEKPRDERTRYFPKDEVAWVEFIGGEKNVVLRLLLEGKSLSI